MVYLASKIAIVCNLYLDCPRTCLTYVKFVRGQFSPKMKYILYILGGIFISVVTFTLVTTICLYGLGLSDIKSSKIATDASTLVLFLFMLYFIFIEDNTLEKN